MLENISTADAQYAIDLIKAICEQVGPGNPGSPQERERAKMIQKALASHLGEGNTSLEEFTLAPNAWLSSYPMCGLLLSIAILCNYLAGHAFPDWALPLSIIALVFSVLAPLPFILIFYLNLELVDRFFKKSKSVNVVGRLCQPGSAEVKRLIILSGHHDSAPANTWFTLLNGIKRRIIRPGQEGTSLEDNWLRILGYVFYFFSTTLFLGFITLLILSIIQLVGLSSGGAGLVKAGSASLVLLIYPLVPSIIFVLFFNHGRKGAGTVPGAVDNLSGSALVVAMCRFLVNNPSILPPDTEVRFISFGAEEAGLRGSRRYVERHLDELRRRDTFVLNIETVANPVINIMTAEASGSVTVSPEYINSLADAAQRAGVPYKLTSPWLGAGGDAAPFSQAGIKATTLLPFLMPQQMIAFYHQKWDSPEILSPEALLNVFKLALEWVYSGSVAEIHLVGAERVLLNKGNS